MSNRVIIDNTNYRVIIDNTSDQVIVDNMTSRLPTSTNHKVKLVPNTSVTTSSQLWLSRLLMERQCNFLFTHSCKEGLNLPLPVSVIYLNKL